MFSKVEGVLSHREALFDRARDQHDVLGVSVAKNCVRQNVALRRARGQTRRRSHALNVPNHSRNFRVVSQTCKLGHQRNSRPGRGSHSASSRPTRTHYHTNRGQLIFGLHNRECCLAIWADAEPLHVLDHHLHQRGGRGDRIPGHHCTTGKHTAQRGSRVAVDDDLPCRFVHALDVIRVTLGEACSRIIEPCLHGGQVQVGGFDFLGELLADGLL